VLKIQAKLGSKKSYFIYRSLSRLMRQEVPRAANRTVYRMAVFTGFATYQCAVVIFIEPCARVRASILPFCLLISSYNFYTRVYKYVRPPDSRVRRKRLDLFTLVIASVWKERRTLQSRAFAKNTRFDPFFLAGGSCTMLPFPRGISLRIINARRRVVL